MNIFLDTKWNLLTQRQSICPIMPFMSIGNFGAKLQVTEYDMTHRSKCTEMF